MFKKSLLLSVFLGLVVFANSAGAAYIPVPGDLLRTAEDQTVVLVMDDLTRVPLSADAYMMRYNNNFALVKVVSADQRGSYDSDRLTLNSTMSLLPGAVFMYDYNQPGIFMIENGYKRLFTTWTGFEANGNNLNNVQWVGQYTLYPTGANVQ